MCLLFKGENIIVRSTHKTIRGVRQNFEIIDRPKIVLCIPFIDSDSIILTHQYRAAIDSYSIEFPAGKIMESEHPKAAMARELAEEIGYESKTLHEIGHFYSAPHLTNEEVIVFKASGLITQSNVPTAKEEFKKMIMTSLEGALKLVNEGAVTDAKTIVALTMVNKINMSF